MMEQNELLNLLDTVLDFVERFPSDDNQHEDVIAQSENSIFTLRLSSFGYKYGALHDTDLNINVRSVENPSVKLRKNQTGLQKRFRKDFFKIRNVMDFYESVTARIMEAIETKMNSKQMDADQPDHLFIGIGCEFGKHRSVSFVEKLAEDLHRASIGPYELLIVKEHRDVERSTAKKATSKRKKRKY